MVAATIGAQWDGLAVMLCTGGGQIASWNESIGIPRSLKEAAGQRREGHTKDTTRMHKCMHMHKNSIQQNWPPHGDEVFCLKIMNFSKMLIRVRIIKLTLNISHRRLIR